MIVFPMPSKAAFLDDGAAIYDRSTKAAFLDDGVAIYDRSTTVKGYVVHEDILYLSADAKPPHQL